MYLREKLTIFCKCECNIKRVGGGSKFEITNSRNTDFSNISHMRTKFPSTNTYTQNREGTCRLCGRGHMIIPSLNSICSCIQCRKVISSNFGLQRRFEGSSYNHRFEIICRIRVNFALLSPNDLTDQCGTTRDEKRYRPSRTRRIFIR